jgi:hypothetical protein
MMGMLEVEEETLRKVRMEKPMQPQPEGTATVTTITSPPSNYLGELPSKFFSVEISHPPHSVPFNHIT